MYFKKNRTHLASLYKTLLTLGIGFLVSCQSSQLHECENVNWRKIGLQAALSGKNRSLDYDKHVQKCKSYNTPVSLTAFDEGYDKGLVGFCTVSNGYDFGSKGKEYQQTCPKATALLFLKGYFRGRIEYLANEKKNLETLLAEAKDRLLRKEREYTVLLSENPEQAKMELSNLDAYKDETQKLESKLKKVNVEFIKTKRKYQETHFM